MKYANQLNILLALGGVAVVIYAVSVTYLGPEPVVSLDIETAPRQSRERSAARRPVADVPPVLRGSTTTQDRSVEVSQRTRMTPSASAVVGRSQNLTTRRTSGTGRRTIQGPRSPSTSAPRVVRPVPNPQTGAGRIDRRSPPFQSSPRDRALSSGQAADRATGDDRLRQPPPGAEAAKRDSGSGPLAPPIRSSMPARPRN